MTVRQVRRDRDRTGRRHVRRTGVHGRGEAGQGTIEYIGLILLLGAVLAVAGYAIDGDLVRTVFDAIKDGIGVALSNLGV